MWNQKKIVTMTWAGSMYLKVYFEIHLQVFVFVFKFCIWICICICIWVFFKHLYLNIDPSLIWNPVHSQGFWTQVVHQCYYWYYCHWLVVHIAHTWRGKSPKLLSKQPKHVMTAFQLHRSKQAQCEHMQLEPLVLNTIQPVLLYLMVEWLEVLCRVLHDGGGGVYHHPFTLRQLHLGVPPTIHTGWTVPLLIEHYKVKVCQ